LDEVLEEESFGMTLWIVELGLVRLENPLRKWVPFYKNPKRRVSFSHLVFLRTAPDA